MKSMWAEKKDNHIYIYWRGEVIYKKGNPSILFNKYFPNEMI